MKICFIFIVAYLICRRDESVSKFWSGLVPILCTALPVLGLLVIQEHLSAMLIIAFVLLAMLLIAGAKIIHLMLVSGLGATTACMYVFSTEFRKQRLLIFLDPWQDSLGKGWQIIQSLYAISSGGLFGVGLRTRCSKIHVYI